MNKTKPHLHSVAINVRAVDDTYSCTPLRVLKAVGEAEGIAVQLATIEAGENHLRIVEGKTVVGIINPEKIEGLVERLSEHCDVLAIDLPIDPERLEEDGLLLRRLREDAEKASVRSTIFMPVGGVLSELEQSFEGSILLGNEPVRGVSSHSFDPMMLRWEDRPPFILEFPDDYLDQNNRPLSDYTASANPEEGDFGRVLDGFLDFSGQDAFLRSILDRLLPD